MDVRSEQIRALCEHAASVAEEVCGVLIGRRGPTLVLETSVAGRNAHPTPERHFLLDAATLLRADAEARAAGLDIIGFYHSHPSGTPLPSPHDRRDAWPGHTLLIIAWVGSHCAVSAWHVADDGSCRPESIRPRPTDGTRPAQS